MSDLASAGAMERKMNIYLKSHIIGTSTHPIHLFLCVLRAAIAKSTRERHLSLLIDWLLITCISLALNFELKINGNYCHTQTD